MSEVSPENRISRFAKKSKVHDDGENIRIDAEAFKLRGGEDYLSVNDLEMHEGDTVTEKVLHLIKSPSMQMNIKKNDYFAIHKVGQMQEYVKTNSIDERNLIVSYKPDPNIHYDSHAGIYGVLQDDDLILELISECVQDSVKVSEGK